MNIQMEQVDKLKERADVSYKEAKEALEQSGGDLLEAMILLEKEGKVNAGTIGNYDSRGSQSRGETAGSGDRRQTGGPAPGEQQWAGGTQAREGKSFGDVLRDVWRFCCRMVHKGNINHFVTHREGHTVLSIPVTLLIILLLVFPWVLLPIMIIALFFGCRYRFCGPDLGKNDINRAMDDAAEVAESLKRATRESVSEAGEESRDPR